ncbi:MAG: head GIN domain-containing protein [Chitinophagaceae bacterium]
MKKIVSLLIIATIILSSCRGGLFGKRVLGDGNIKTETRSAPTFNSVDVSGSMNLYIKNDAERSIRIEADANLLPYIVVETEGDRLIIRPKDGNNLKPTNEIKVYVSSPIFKKIEASGACDVFSENQINSSETVDIGLSGASHIKMDVKAPKVTADISGACGVELKGETKEFSGEGSGSSDFKCFDLMAEDVSIDISGAGDAEVYASVKLNAEVTGAGDVKYKGKPKLSQSISGAGSVTPVD